MTLYPRPNFFNRREDFKRRSGDIKLQNGSGLYVFHSGISEQSGLLGCDTNTKGDSLRFERLHFIRTQGSPDRPKI